MRKLLTYSFLLIAGLVVSQFLPGWLGDSAHSGMTVIRVLTLIALAFIMIHVGLEFDIDKKNPRQYGTDYLVAMTAAAFPWIFVTGYFVFVLLPASSWTSWDAWKEALLTGRFAAPTSAGVLFSMLAAAGLGATWMFRKARILAIFDDLDTVLLMIPLKMMMVGLAWQLGAVVVIMALLLWVAWRYLHELSLPTSWPWVMAYGVGIVLLCELAHKTSMLLNSEVPIHIEVLLPAFVLGCVLKKPHPDAAQEHSHHASPGEERAATLIASAFMVLVGLNMPPILNQVSQGAMSWGTIAIHVLAVTVLSNLGKMYPVFCYRQEAPFRERLATAIAMWPRGEVGAGVLVLSLTYGISGPMVTIAMLSLALNLVLTGVFVLIVKRLLAASKPA